MTWSFVHSASGATLAIPGNLTEFKVGRQENCFLRITDDQSVSREHAVVAVSDGGKLSIKDCDSKFGTFINGERVAPNQFVLVQARFVIKFGALTSEYALEKTDPDTHMDRMLLAKRLIDNHKDINWSAVKRFNRQALFEGIKFKTNALSDFIVKCGGQIDDAEGLEWSKDEILDAIVCGRLKGGTASRYTVVEELVLPDKPSSSVPGGLRKGKRVNFKTFRKTYQSCTLPDIIGISDMVVHSSSGASTAAGALHRNETWLSETRLPPIHEQYKTARPIEQHFERKQGSSTTKTADHFETDFFKGLL